MATLSLFRNPTFQRTAVRPFLMKYMSTTTKIDDFLTVNHDDGIKNIVLNNPKTRNSLSYDMMFHLLDSIKTVSTNTSVRALVLSANGTVFSAGHNLKELSAQTGVEFHRKVFKKSTELMKSIIDCPVPVIAKINGLAAAAGCQLVATCDIVICTENSTFSTPGANFGIFCSTPGIAVGRCVPKMTATYMLFTGLSLSSNEALNAGLVTKVVSAEKLDSEVKAICDAIKIKSRSVMKLGKEFYYKQIALNANEAYQCGEEIMVKNINMEDGQEGINSFVQKRKPKWTESEN